MLLLLACSTGAEPPAPPPPAVEPPPVVEPAPPPPKTLQFTMTVAPELGRDLVHLDAGSYPEDALDPLFQKMRTDGDAYCAMVQAQNAGTGRYERTRATTVIAEESLATYGAKCRGCEWQMRAGCWNFYAMNDMRPDDDFVLVDKLYPDAAFDCYGIGFVQPYMMHNVLGCRSLTMIDFDWRIQDAHYQLLRLVRAGGFGSAEAATASMEKMQVGWTAFRKGTEPTHAGSLATFCPAGQRDLCLDHLVKFQANWESLETIQLDLAGLHETRFVDTPPETVRVYYFSNALESIYTQRPEFDTLMKGLTAALAPGQTAVLLHHVGGYRHFGLYTVVASPEAKSGNTVTTVCRDPYEATSIGHTEETYTIHLDDVSVTKKTPPTCHALMKG